MLENAARIHGFKLGALDGEIGRVKDLYFDDANWTIRYLVADTGTWLPERQVLISPWALKRVNEVDKTINVNLTKQQIEDCPSITSDLPVSRQYEIEYYKYYGWPMYWYGPALWGPGPYPAYFGHGGGAVEAEHRPITEDRDPHLRSTRDMTDYRIHALDGEIGHVDDFIFDDASWVIRYIIVDTRNWWPGKKVLVSPEWISHISWEKSTVDVDLHRDTIKEAPDYDPYSRISREYETQLFDHYRREAYWQEVPAGK